MSMIVRCIGMMVVVDGMHTDALQFARNCSSCHIMLGGGKLQCPHINSTQAFIVSVLGRNGYAQPSFMVLNWYEITHCQ